MTRLPEGVPALVSWASSISNDRCWGDGAHTDVRPFADNGLSTTDVGLCSKHYDEIVGAAA